HALYASADAVERAQQLPHLVAPQGGRGGRQVALRQQLRQPHSLVERPAHKAVQQEERGGAAQQQGKQGGRGDAHGAFAGGAGRVHLGRIAAGLHGVEIVDLLRQLRGGAYVLLAEQQHFG